MNISSLSGPYYAPNRHVLSTFCKTAGQRKIFTATHFVLSGVLKKSEDVQPGKVNVSSLISKVLTPIFIPMFMKAFIDDMKALLESIEEKFSEGIRDAVLKLIKTIVGLSGAVVDGTLSLLKMNGSKYADNKGWKYVVGALSGIGGVFGTIDSITGMVQCQKMIGFVQDEKEGKKELKALKSILKMVSEKTDFWSQRRGLGLEAQKTIKELLPNVKKRNEKAVANAKNLVKEMLVNVRAKQRSYIISLFVNIIAVATFAFLVAGAIANMPVLATVSTVLGFVGMLGWAGNLGYDIMMIKDAKFGEFKKDVEPEFV